MSQAPWRADAALAVPAFAKINLGLEVLRRRDDGFHELRTIFQTIDLSDEIVLSPRRGRPVVRCEHPDVPSDESNLALRAAVELRRFAGIDAGVEISLTKRIPVAAGLGGGSSDAAAVLRGLDHAWGLGLGISGLLPLARRLGADVPYFLFGGTALGIARGDEVYPLERQLRTVVVVVDPGVPVSTAAVFGRLDQSLTARENGNNIFRFLSEDRQSLQASSGPWVNDLEDAAVLEFPELGAKLRGIRDVLVRAGALWTSLSGSGSAYYGLFDDAGKSRRAHAGVVRMGYGAYRAITVTRNRFRARWARALGVDAKRDR